MKKYIIIFVVFLGLVLLVALILRDNDSSDYYSEQDDISQNKLTLTEDIDPWDDGDISYALPQLLDTIPNQIIKKYSYTLSYNRDTKLPNWVVWHLTAAHTDGPWPRCKLFYEDEEVPQPRVTIDDYRGSGWTRGHMCPAGDNKWDEKAMYDTFSLINICPQNENLNNGLWNSIENDCRKWARKYGDIYIVCGPVFMNREHETIGANNVVVPEAFFKVVLCLTGTPKGFGFVVRNTDDTKKKDLNYNSIDDIERITNIDFFPALPDKIEDIVESQCNIKDW